MEEKNKEMQVIQALSDLIDETSELMLSQKDVLTTPQSLGAILMVVLEQVFLSAPDNIDAHKFINSIMVSAKNNVKNCQFETK